MADTLYPNLTCSVTTLLITPTLGSFDPLYYLYFMLATMIVPYPLYWQIAQRLKWETNSKTPARHWNDMVGALSYGCLVFTFGDYTRTLSWIQLVAFYIALFAYGWIAELPFTKTSLPDIAHWPFGMWMVFLFAIVAILAFAAYHIYVAVHLGGTFWIYYVCALLVPAFLLVVGILWWQDVDYNVFRRLWAKLIAPFRRFASKSAQPEDGVSTEPILSTIPPSPYTTKISFHPHHWQIFYTLAFWTRFPDPVSQVAAGIVMGCYMQGVIAYGYDSLLLDSN